MAKRMQTMSALLRACLKETPSLTSVTEATGVQKASLIRFVKGRQSLRLDIADRLAAHFGIVCKKVK
jgi:plasmid maintenance system antidote protein VapI